MHLAREDDREEHAAAGGRVALLHQSCPSAARVVAGRCRGASGPQVTTGAGAPSRPGSAATAPLLSRGWCQHPATAPPLVES